MSIPIKNQYLPDYVSPPGETIHETLEALGMTQNEFATRMGITPKTVTKLLQGDAPIRPDTALALEKVLNVPARFWNNLETQYQEYLARQKEAEELEKHAEWVKEFPFSDMAALTYVNAVKPAWQRVRELLQFFGVASPAEWETVWAKPDACFRHSAALKSSSHALSAWLRQGEKGAAALDLPAYDPTRFQKNVSAVRELICEPVQVFEPEMIRLCRESGVALLFEKPLPKVRVSGACRWISDRPVILLSLRYKTDDHFWFTFFHESKHVLQCVKKRLFVDVPGEEHDDPKEKEANAFARTTLLPPKQWADFIAQRDFSGSAIRSFATQMGITPGIVVGQLQFSKKLRWETTLNQLKCRFTWADEAGI